MCGFALFDFERHGDSRYGAPVSGEADQRSCDGKMEKAYLSFRANHPSWRDDTLQGAELLSKIGGNGSAEAVHLTAAAAAAAACAAGSASCACLLGLGLGLGSGLGLRLGLGLGLGLAIL